MPSFGEAYTRESSIYIYVGQELGMENILVFIVKNIHEKNTVEIFYCSDIPPDFERAHLYDFGRRMV